MLYLKIRAMKKLILTSLLVLAMGMLAFMGCERPEPIDPTKGQPQRANEDSLINQQEDTLPGIITVEHWGAISKFGYYDYVEGIYHYEPYTYGYMDIYPQDGVLTATDIDSTDGYELAFAGGEYWPYSISGDTITVYYDTYGELFGWRVSHYAADSMSWRYLGTCFDNRCVCTFYLIGVE